MGQRRTSEDRLSDLSDRTYVAVYCGNWRCEKHSGGTHLDIPAIIEKYGDLPLENLGLRFRCGKCGHRPAEIRQGHKLPNERR